MTNYLFHLRAKKYKKFVNDVLPIDSLTNQKEKHALGDIKDKTSILKLQLSSFFSKLFSLNFCYKIGLKNDVI